MIRRIVADALEGRKFSTSVDLGCGTGDGGVLIRPHTSYLIGVDVDAEALREAGRRGVYDELVQEDMRVYPLGSADSVFMFDSLEHISKEDGVHLLEGCVARYTLLSTPWWSTPVLSNPGHECVWSDEELRALGFTTSGHNFMPDVPMYVMYGGVTLGVRE